MNFIRKLAHETKWRFHQAFDAWKDRKLGIDASGRTETWDLGSEGPNATHSYVYLGAPHLVLDFIFQRLNIVVSRFTFVDLGSGKARVVLRAATYPFRQCEGVELSRKVHDVAVENVARAERTGALRSPVVVLNEDALEYRLPATPMVLFFFNPFDRVVLKQFMEKLERSLRDNPRECYFIYLNPRSRDCIDAIPVIREIPLSRMTRAMIRVLSPWPLALFHAPVATAERTAQVEARPSPSHELASA